MRSSSSSSARCSNSVETKSIPTILDHAVIVYRYHDNHDDDQDTATAVRESRHHHYFHRNPQAHTRRVRRASPRRASDHSAAS